MTAADQTPEYIRKALRQLAKAGGRARAASLSPERRSEIAKLAAAARERKRRLAKKAKPAV